MATARTVFFVSDHTGITAEIIGQSLLSQFPGEQFTFVSVAFIDDLQKAVATASRIRDAAAVAAARPIVFSTLTDPGARNALTDCGALLIDVYGQFLGVLTGELGRAPEPTRGRSHGVGNTAAYRARIDAVNYTLATDDGLGTEKYALADVILVGVSRCGKTPTSLYLALQHGLRAANYPLTPENFAQAGLPESLRPHRHKLRGLTLEPARLAQIRAERRPDSHYASLENCRDEIASAEALLRSAGIPVIDTSSRSIEEIATLLKLSLNPPPSGQAAENTA